MFDASQAGPRSDARRTPARVHPALPRGGAECHTPGFLRPSRLKGWFGPGAPVRSIRSQMNKIKGRYEVKSKLGEGGMGVVLRAYDPPPMDREVAVKTLHDFGDRFALDLFYKECTVLKSISHPNIVEIFDMGEFEEGGEKKPFFVMPLLRGQTLHELIKNSSHRLTVERVVQIISQTCRGLQAAHEHGLVHRDLKPSNLFVISDDSVKIIDFGVAHVVDERSQTRSMKGTLLYMSPEQLQSKPVSAQSDIFSLGVVCYEALTRRLPFRGATQEEIIDAVRTHTPPPASEINPAVSQAISRAVHKAMAKQPWNRYDSAKEFGETLQKALHNQPIELFDPARIQPRIDRAAKALESGDHQFAGEIVSELEASGHIDPQITLLKTEIDQVVRRRTIAQLLESARARYEEEEDPLALQKLQEILQVDPGNVQALSLKSKINDRRSERQIEKWMRLAEEHVKNHSYGHAREALQNVLSLRPKDSRALQLVKDLEVEEQEYLHLRQEKAQLYQSALNAWKNGDVSEALSHMRLVLELDGQAPDILSPETGASYQNFYNKVRSEHDLINNGSAEARRRAAGDSTRALELCLEFLEKYPGQALFQALKFDVEEQQRQQLSAFIADVNRRLEAESDLNAKVSLLREAIEKYPEEPHFERSLKLMADKRDLVNSIVLRAQMHEERGLLNEAISDFETLGSIYPLYPGLKFERERLQKRREQQSRDVARANWVRQIDRVREARNYERMLELVEKAQGDFPEDAEFLELKNLAQQGFDRTQQAEALLAEGQRLCAAERFEEALEILKRAVQLDEGNPSIRMALRDALVETARTMPETAWRGAEVLIENALEIDPQNQLAKTVRAQVHAAKRDDAIMQSASQARRWQAAGELAKAEAALKKALAAYPGDPRLTAILDTVQHELEQSNKKKARAIESRYTGPQSDDDITTMAREIDRVAPAASERATAGESSAGAVPIPTPQIPEPAEATGATTAPKQRSYFLGVPSWIWISAGAALLVAVGLAVGIRQRRDTPKTVSSSSAVQVSVRVRTSPAGATIRVDGQVLGTSEAELTLQAGDHEFEASLPGYAVARQKASLGGNAPPVIDLSLLPLVQSVRLVAPDVENGDVWLDEATRKLEGGSTTIDVPADGQHLLRLAAPKSATAAAKIGFNTQAGSMPTVTLLEVPQRQVVAVSSMETEARVTSSFNGAAIAVDGQPRGAVTAEGLMVRDLSSGVHELTIGEGKDLRKMAFTVGPAPSLDAAFFSDRDVGSVLVVTAEDDVIVVVDGRPYARKTVNGQVRITNLASQSHTIRIAKDGFSTPQEQSVDVVKGQEAIVRFELVPVLKTATLSIRQMIPGVQVFLDDSPTALGTVTAAGTLSHSDIGPGSHVLRFVMDGYQPKRLTREFVAGETVSLSSGDIEMVRAAATLDVAADANVTVTVRKDNNAVDQFLGPRKLSLAEGSYTIEGRNPDGQTTSQSVELKAGESASVRLRLTAILGMEGFDPAQWTKTDMWYTRRGGGRFALYNQARALGRITFAFNPPGRRLLGGAQHVKWAVAFTNDKNHVLIDLDSKELTRSVVTDGKKTDILRLTHKLPWDNDFIRVAIEISANSLIQQFQAKDGEWQTFDSWDRSDPRTRAIVQSFADGKFGFDSGVEVANFAFYPKER
jgi:eukaryotic-like serine/threonine-protein kinase